MHSHLQQPDAPAIALRGITKSFGHVDALQGIDLRARSGEILALLGDNGAGKSTLLKITSGLLRPDAGEILIAGRPVDFHSPADARSAGVAAVYQDLGLVECMDVSTNMYLGQLPMRGPFVNRKRMDRESSRFLQKMGVRVGSVRTQVGMLSGGQRQMVAVARTIRVGAEVVLFDEPTAALGVRETAQALEMITGLRDQGKAVIMISHDMESVFAVADRLQVLRLGRVAGVRDVRDTNRADVVALMTGAISDSMPAGRREAGGYGAGNS